MNLNFAIILSVWENEMKIPELSNAKNPVNTDDSSSARLEYFDDDPKMDPAFFELSKAVTPNLFFSTSKIFSFCLRKWRFPSLNPNAGLVTWMTNEVLFMIFPVSVGKISRRNSSFWILNFTL